MKPNVCTVLDHTNPTRQRGTIWPSLALRVSIAGVLLAWAPSSVHAALDADAKKPYQLQVVLHVASNRVFTPLFLDQLQRDVQNQLKLSFGALAHIEVTRAHPLLRDIDSKGLDAALEGFDALSERCTHFVLLDHVAGTYPIQARFHDGLTGQNSPLTQRLDIHDRTAVAATITKLIETSFSPVGTVTAVGKEVTLTLKGGALGVPMDRWIERGHVFAVSRIVEEGGRPRAERLEWALLEVLELSAPGVCRCKFWHRYKEDSLSEGFGTQGYRAVKLPSVKGIIKVQLLDDATVEPLYKARVQVIKPGAKPLELETNRDGVALTLEPFAHFAFVRVLSGDTVRAQFPVEVIVGRTIIARVKIQADGEALAALRVRRDSWLLRVYENVRMSSERAAELSGLLNQSLEAAVEAGRRRAVLVEAELKYLEGEHSDLSRLLKEKQPDLSRLSEKDRRGFELQEGAKQIDVLRKQTKDLQTFNQRLEAVVKDADEKTVGLHKLLERARLLEADADFEPALRLYDQVVQASPDETKIRAHRDRLKEAWKTKDEAHAKARAYIYQVWPTVGIVDLAKNLDDAKKALDVCKNAGDKLTPLRLVRINVAHTVNLKKQLETLKRRDSEDNRNRAKELAETSERLLRLHRDATAFLGNEPRP